MAAKTHPYLSKLQYSAAGADPYTTLTDMFLIAPVAMTRGVSPRTHLESASMAREKAASWIDAGNIPAQAYFAKAQFATLLTKFALSSATAEEFWRVLFPLLSGETNNSRFDCKAFVQAIGFSEINTEDDGNIFVPFTLEITGLPTFTSGS